MNESNLDFDSAIYYQGFKQKLVLNEQKSLYVGINTNEKELICFEVDKKLLFNIESCDFLLQVPCDNKSILIELKGSDVLKAVKQISNTLEYLSDNLNKFNVFGRIVLTRVNTQSLNDTSFLRLKKNARKNRW